jgi:hypothetical protein
MPTSSTKLLILKLLVSQLFTFGQSEMSPGLDAV